MAGETLNPFPDYPSGLVYGKVGYPVSFALEASQILELTSFTMTENGQTTPVSAYVYTKATDPNHYIGNNEAYLTAKTQLKPSTKYNMQLQGKVNGLAFSCVNGVIVFGKTEGCSWSFTTASGLVPSF